MTVFDFRAAHSLKQLKQNRATLVGVLDNIRATLARLFETKLVYHMAGSQAARLMLEAQERLTQVLDAIDAMEEERDPSEIKALQSDLNAVGELTQKAAATLKSISFTQS